MARIPAYFFGAFLFVSASGELSRGQETNLPDHLRRYSDGPLAAEDFCGAVPNRRPRENGIQLDAFTSVEIRYDLRYHGQTRASRTTLTLTSIDVYAVVDQSKSWNSQKSNRDLLDHEQGHFDLAAIYALRVQVDFENQLDAGRVISTVGANQADAALAMQREIDRLIGPALDAMVKANQQYDVLTANGSKRAIQQRERKQQLDEIASLIDELRRLRRK